MLYGIWFFVEIMRLKELIDRFLFQTMLSALIAFLIWTSNPSIESHRLTSVTTREMTFKDI